MRRRLALALLVLTATLLPAVARATVGGPTTLRVLGYAPVDRKLFVVEQHHGEGDGPPQLYYLAVDGPRRGLQIAVRRAESTADTHARLGRLERRLLAPEAVGLAEFTSTRERLRRVHVRTDPDTLRPGWRTRMTVRHRDAAQPATLEFVVYTGGDPPRRPPRIVHAARLPGLALAIVVVRYLGDPSETGYERDQVVLVPMAR